MGQFGRGTQYLLPLPDAVLPGHTRAVSTMPQLTCRIENIITSTESAESFDVLDIRVGKNSMFAAGGELPLRPFGLDSHLLKHLLTARSGPPVNGDKGDIVRPLLELGPVLQGQPVTMQVTNRSSRPRSVEAAFVVRTADEPGPRDPWAGPNPSRECEVCGGDAERLAPEVEWCALCGSVTIEDKLQPSAFGLVADEERIRRIRDYMKRSRQGRSGG